MRDGGSVGPQGTTRRVTGGEGESDARRRDRRDQGVRREVSREEQGRRDGGRNSEDVGRRADTGRRDAGEYRDAGNAVRRDTVGEMRREGDTGGHTREGENRRGEPPPGSGGRRTRVMGEGRGRGRGGCFMRIEE